MRQAKPDKSALARLAKLRLKLTIALSALTLIGLAVLATVTILVDGQLRQDRANTELQGFASRAAALAFVDESTEKWNFTGMIDDSVAEEVDSLMVVMADGTTAVTYGEGLTGTEKLVTLSLDDAEEAGAIGESVLSDGTSVPTAAAPFFDANEVAGTVLVALAGRSDPDHNRLVAFVLGSAAALTALTAFGAWIVAGRVVQPLGASLDREEAFLATAAHQLRTPVGRSRAVAESAMLTLRSVDPSDAKDQLKRELTRLVSTTGEATESINDLLLAGRLDAEHVTKRMEPTRLDTLVAGFEANYRELAVETDGVVEIEGDPVLVSHAIINLLSNAQRHGRRPDEPLLIEARVYSEGSEAVVLVSDNGPGPSPEMLSRLFQRHQTSGGGTGLGLWIVTMIMEQHGGTVKYVGSDSGAAFELRWPTRS